MKNRRIAIIGGGNLGAAIAEGLIKSKFVDPADLTVTRRNLQSLLPLKNQGVKVTSNNHEAIRENDVIIVALKPYNVKEILEGLKDDFDPSKHIVISVVTGILLKDLTAIVDHGVPIFRAIGRRAHVTRDMHLGAAWRDDTGYGSRA